MILLAIFPPMVGAGKSWAHRNASSQHVDPSSASQTCFGCRLRPSSTEVQSVFKSYWKPSGSACPGVLSLRQQLGDVALEQGDIT